MEYSYLDHHATTPCDPQVLEAMLPFYGSNFGNPGSPHYAGRRAALAIDEARSQVASLFTVPPDGVIFTSGATEANNLAISGIFHGSSDTQRKGIAFSAVEHKAVSQVCKSLSSFGMSLNKIPVDPYGKIVESDFERIVSKYTLLVSIQIANGEIGTMQPLQAIGKHCRNEGVFWHADAAQAAAWIPLQMQQFGIHLMSVSSHKIHGPQGVGALVCAPGMHARLAPLMYGGGQEGGKRPGTPNVPAIVGFGEACRLSALKMDEDYRRLSNLRNAFEARLQMLLPNVHFNGDIANRLPNNSSVTITGIDSDVLVARLPNIALSTGAACDTGALSPSHSLLAIGLSRDLAYSTLRVGLGRFTEMNEVLAAADSIATEVLSISRC